MSHAYEDILHLVLPSDDDESHGPEMRQNLTTLAMVSAPDNLFFVSPGFTDANLDHASATDQRHYSTIQAAITAAQSTGVTSRNVIVIEDGDYLERLSFTDTITLRSRNKPTREGMGAGLGVNIRGDGTQNPVLTITPTNGSQVAVNFQGICFDNQYDTTAGTITSAYLLEIADQSTYGTTNYVTMNDCQVRAQTWGSGNVWDYLVRSTGQVRFYATNSAFFTGGHGGGDLDGGIKTMFRILGNNPSIQSVAGFQSCQFHEDYNGAGVPAVISIDEGVTGFVADCDFWTNGLKLVTGATGTNFLNGMDAENFAAYGNREGINNLRF